MFPGYLLLTSSFNSPYCCWVQDPPGTLVLGVLTELWTCRCASCPEPASGRWSFCHSEPDIIGPCGTLMAATWGQMWRKERANSRKPKGWMITLCIFILHDKRNTVQKAAQWTHLLQFLVSFASFHQGKTLNYLSGLISGTSSGNQVSFSNTSTTDKFCFFLPWDKNAQLKRIDRYI